MSRSKFDLIAGHLKSARYAFKQNACFGQVTELRLPHKDLPNGCPAKVRVAVGPDVIICRVINVGRDHRAFDAAAQPLLAFATNEMCGWNTAPNSSGTGGGKIFWNERHYWPRRIEPTNHNYADLLQAVSSAREACVSRSRFRTSSNEKWQSAYMDNGVYPVTWTVEAQDTEVVVRVKNRGSDSDAFSRLIHWTFDYIKAHNSDGRGRHQTLGIVFKIFSDTLRLEVPCR